MVLAALILVSGTWSQSLVSVLGTGLSGTLSVILSTRSIVPSIRSLIPCLSSLIPIFGIFYGFLL